MSFKKDMKYYTIKDDEVYCYAKDEQDAKELFLENDESLNGVALEVEEVGENTVVYETEIIGIGGYDTIEIYAFVRNKDESEYIGRKQDIKETIDLWHYTNEGF